MRLRTECNIGPKVDMPSPTKGGGTSTWHDEAVSAALGLYAWQNERGADRARADRSWCPTASVTF
jgi:hypothetical protein